MREITRNNEEKIFKMKRRVPHKVEIKDILVDTDFGRLGLILPVKNRKRDDMVLFFDKESIDILGLDVGDRVYLYKSKRGYLRPLYKLTYELYGYEYIPNCKNKLNWLSRRYGREVTISELKGFLQNN